MAASSLTLQIEQKIEVQSVIEIAEQAAAAILKIYNGEVGQPQGRGAGRRPLRGGGRLTRPRRFLQAEAWQVEQKADSSPLTRADRDANAVICEGLARIGGRGRGGWRRLRG